MRLEIWLQSSLENAAYHRPIRPFAVSPSPALFSAEPSAPLKVCPDMTRLCCVWAAKQALGNAALGALFA